MQPIVTTPQTVPMIPDAIKLKIANLSEFVALARTYIERDGHSREAQGVPVTEGNTRLPQQLCQIARGSALLDGRCEVNEDDYKLVRRVAFDSVPPDSAAVLRAVRDGKSPFSLGLPKATVARAIDDLKLSGVLTEESTLSEVGKQLLVGAGLEHEVEVPETSPR